MSQSVLGKSASAVPQVDGLGVRVGLVRSAGIALRGKNQVRIPAVRSSRAYTWCIVVLAMVSRV